MSDQPEALRLADALQQQAVWEGHYGPSYLRDLLPEAAAELRRLHKVEAERDALVTLQKVRYEIASGETRGEMAAHCREEGGLYRIGDAILVWVNEGDIIAFGQRIDAAKGDK